MAYSYRSLKGASEALIKKKGSKFIGYATTVRSTEETGTFLNDIKSLHPTARHHCYAWRLGHPDPSERANDDGEPSGTAGRPILGQLVKQDLTDAMVVVVRYFGGTLLGTSGLIQSYKECAEAVLQSAEIIRIIMKETWEIDLEFGIVHLLEEWAPKLEFSILERNHVSDRMRYKLEIAKSESLKSRIQLIARLTDSYAEEVDPEQLEYAKFSITKK